MILCFSDMVAKCWITKEDTVVFGHVGRNITLHSIMRGPLDRYGITSWNHETNGGRIQLKFHEYFYRKDVITVDSWSNISYTIEDPKVSDSGRYFAVQLNGFTSSSKSSSGSSIYLVVTDPNISPVMRVFDGRYDTAGTREFVCEVEGAGLGWSDPFWVMEHEGQKTEVRQQTQNRLNEDGLFLRWTGISLPLMENSMRKVVCVCHHDSEGTIEMSVMEDGGSILSCNLLYVFGPLCVLIAVVATVLLGRWIYGTCSDRQVMQG